MHAIKIPLRFLLALLLLAPAVALAQDTLQDKMTPAEFKAAGLDKLSAQELAALNAWLQGKVVEETRRVATETRKEVEQEHRGFFDFGSSEPVVSRLKGEFSGFGNGRRYVLENGQEWRQVDNAKLHGVRRSNPEMTIRPSLLGNTWYLTVEGYNTRARVQRIK
jgi:hypothetical protein